MTNEQLRYADDEKIEDIRVSITGNNNTVLIEDFFPLPQSDRRDEVGLVWLTVSEARGLRDWLNKVLP